MYMQDYLLGNTKLSNNDIAIIDSKSTNKYTNLYQQKKIVNIEVGSIINLILN